MRAQGLINTRRVQANISAVHVKQKVARILQGQLACTAYLKLNAGRVSAGRDDEVILQMLLASVIYEVGAGIYPSIADLRVLRNVRMPPARDVTQQVITAGGELLGTHDLWIGIAAHQLQPDG